MKTITVEEIKLEVAKKNNCEVSCVNCGHCKHWGYNNGKPMNSVFDSRCAVHKEKTWKLSFCRKFEKMG